MKQIIIELEFQSLEKKQTIRYQTEKLDSYCQFPPAIIHDNHTYKLFDIDKEPSFYRAKYRHLKTSHIKDFIYQNKLELIEETP